MKIKRSQLKRVIQEELRSILSEISIADQIAADLTDRASGMYSGDLSGGPQNPMASMSDQIDADRARPDEVEGPSYQTPGGRPAYTNLAGTSTGIGHMDPDERAREADRRRAGRIVQPRHTAFGTHTGVGHLPPAEREAEAQLRRDLAAGTAAGTLVSGGPTFSPVPPAGPSATGRVMRGAMDAMGQIPGLARAGTAAAGELARRMPRTSAGAPTGGAAGGAAGGTMRAPTGLGGTPMVSPSVGTSLADLQHAGLIDMKGLTPAEFAQQQNIQGDEDLNRLLDQARAGGGFGGEANPMTRYRRAEEAAVAQELAAKRGLAENITIENMVNHILDRLV